MPKSKEWSNEVPKDFIEEDVKTPTPREMQMAEAAQKAKSGLPPRLYDVTSNNPKALRVIHDHQGRPVHIEPGTTKKHVLLLPEIAERLAKGDLMLTHSDAAAVEPAA